MINLWLVVSTVCFLQGYADPDGQSGGAKNICIQVVRTSTVLVQAKEWETVYNVIPDTWTVYDIDDDRLSGWFRTKDWCEVHWHQWVNFEWVEWREEEKNGHTWEQYCSVCHKRRRKVTSEKWSERIYGN